MMTGRDPLRRIPGTAALVAVLVVWFVPGTALAQLSETPTAETEAVRAAAEELGDRARQRVEPLPEGQTRVLRAVVMRVVGRTEWRPDVESPWKSAVADDLLDPGSMIRTGRRSSMTLRVGQNATILVDRNTRLMLPEVIQDGQTLHTAVQLTRGRADFKVDRVGLTNDFSVVTPSTTLAVRGTGFAVQYGGFRGTEVFASRFNEMLAIEVSYFLSRYVQQLSGGASSSDEQMNPVIHDLFRTFGPPRILSALIEDGNMPELLIDSFVRNPLYSQRLVDQGRQALDDLLDLPIFDDVDDIDDLIDPFDPFGEYGDYFSGADSAAQVAQFFCDYLTPVFTVYTGLLRQDGLGIQGLDQTQQELASFCGGLDGTRDEDLVTIFSVIVAYCNSQHSDQLQANQCVLNFLVAGNQVWNQPQ